jgi:hypothetical protein
MEMDIRLQDITSRTYILIFTTVKTSNPSLDLSLRNILFPRKSNPWQNLKIYEIMVMNGMTGSEKDNPLA